MTALQFAVDLRASIDSISCGSTGSLSVRLENGGVATKAVSLLLFHVGISANHLVRSAPPVMVPAGGDASATIDIDGGATTGPHLLCAIVHEPDSPLHIPIRPPEPHFYVWVGDAGTLNVEERVSAALRAQREYVEAPIRLEAYRGDEHYTVWLLLDGCLLDYPQPIEGGVMEPLGFGLSCESELAAVKKLLTIDSMPISPQFERDWQSGHPLTLVRYFRVYAPTPTDAFAVASARVDLIRGVLAMVRMAPSRIAIAVVFAKGGESHIVAPRQVYEGNLAPGIGTTEAARQLERFVEAVSKDPWVGLIISMYNEALAENNPLFRIVRIWALFEACAKRAPLPGLEALRTNPSETKSKNYEYDFDGERVRGHDFAKVCYFIQEQSGGKKWGRVDQHYSNCEILRMAYIVRNIGAHEGVVAEQSLRDQEKATAIDFMLRQGGVSALRWLIQYVLYEISQDAVSAAVS